MRRDEALEITQIEPDAMPEPNKCDVMSMALQEPRGMGNSNWNCFPGMQGIDISHHNKNIDWQRVATDPNFRVTYVYMKSTESVTFVDNRFQENTANARAAGLPVGAYHFFNPTTSPQQQLQNFFRQVDINNQDIRPMVDVETRGNCSLSGFQQRLREFCRGIEEHYGVEPVIYTGQYFYQKYLEGAGIDKYVYFIARYSNTPPQMPEHIKFALWQYSDKGKISGITTNTDLSRFMGNYTLRDILIRP